MVPLSTASLNNNNNSKVPDTLFRNPYGTTSGGNFQTNSNTVLAQSSSPKRGSSNYTWGESLSEIKTPESSKTPSNRSTLESLRAETNTLKDIERSLLESAGIGAALGTATAVGVYVHGRMRGINPPDGLAATARRRGLMTGLFFGLAVPVAKLSFSTAYHSVKHLQTPSTASTPAPSPSPGPSPVATPLSSGLTSNRASTHNFFSRVNPAFNNFSKFVGDIFKFAPTPSKTPSNNSTSNRSTPKSLRAETNSLKDIEGSLLRSVGIGAAAGAIAATGIYAHGLFTTRRQSISNPRGLLSASVKGGLMTGLVTALATPAFFAASSRSVKNISTTSTAPTPNILSEAGNFLSSSVNSVGKFLSNTFSSSVNSVGKFLSNTFKPVPTPPKTPSPSPSPSPSPVATPPSSRLPSNRASTPNFKFVGDTFSSSVNSVGKFLSNIFKPVHTATPRSNKVNRSTGSSSGKGEDSTGPLHLLLNLAENIVNTTVNLAENIVNTTGKFVRDTFFRNPYADIYGANSQQYNPNLSGRFSSDYTAFYIGGDILKPISTEGDLYLTPASRLFNNKKRRDAISKANKELNNNRELLNNAAIFAVGALSGLTLVSILHNFSDRIDSRRGFASKLFESSMAELPLDTEVKPAKSSRIGKVVDWVGDKVVGNITGIGSLGSQDAKSRRSLAKNFMPAGIGILTGLLTSGSVEGGIAGGLIGSYAGSYLLMKEELGPQLKPRAAGFLYGGLAALIIADKYFSTKTPQILSSPTTVSSPLKSEFLNPKIYQASNPYSITKQEYQHNVKLSTHIQAPYYYSNPVKHSPGYMDFKSLEFEGLLKGYKPNYRNNPLYKVVPSGFKENTNAPQATTVFDHLNPTPIAYSAGFTSALFLLLSSKLTDYYKDKMWSKVTSVFNISNPIEEKALNIKAQKEVAESFLPTVKGLAEADLDAIGSSGKNLGKGLFNYAKTELLKNIKSIGLTSLVSLSVYHALKAHQHNRAYEITGQEEYAPAAKIVTPNVIHNSALQALIGGVGGAVVAFANLFASSQKLPKYTKLARMVAFGGLVGLGLGLLSGIGRSSTDNIGLGEDIINTGFMGAIAGAGVSAYGDFISNDIDIDIANTNKGIYKRKIIGASLFFAAAGALTGYLSSAEFKNTDQYKPVRSQTIIEEAAVPQGTSKEHETFVKDVMDRSRYLYSGIDTPIGKDTVFSDSLTVGKAFMNFLRQAEDSTVQGGFYEISSDTEFLSLIHRKAQKEGIVVSMGGNVDPFSGLSGALGSLYNYLKAGPLSPLQYGVSKLINFFTESTAGFTIYKTREQLKEDSNETPAKISNAIIGGLTGIVGLPVIGQLGANLLDKIPTSRPPLADLPEPIPSSGGRGISNIMRNKGYMRGMGLLGGLILGGLLGSPELDSTGFEHLMQSGTYLAGSLDYIKSHALAIGREDREITGDKYTGNVFSHLVAMMGRVLFTGGLDITDKVTPFATGRRYTPGNLDNYILHSKFFVDEKRAFFSTGNVDTLIKNSRGEINQTNYGITTENKEVVKEAKEFVKFLKTAKPEDDLSDLAGKFKHIILGGKNSDSSQKIQNFIESANTEIYASLAYPSHQDFVTSFTNRLKAGVKVTILAQNPYGAKAGGNPDLTFQFYKKLIEGGAKVYMLPENSSVLIHAKAIASKDSLLVGSHNLSKNSITSVIEANLQLHGKDVGVPLQQAIMANIEGFGAAEYSLEDRKKAIDNKDIKTLLRYKKVGLDNESLNNILDKQKAVFLLLRPEIEGVSGFSSPYEGLVYLPTSIHHSYYEKYGFGRDPNIYTILAGAIDPDKKDPLKQFSAAYADFALQNIINKGFAPYINAAFPNLYKEGEGFIGTAIRGVGRFLDTITGFYSSLYYDDLRKGLLHGNIKEYNRSFYNRDDRRGVFEKILSSTYNASSSTIYSLAFYFGVSHTLSLARASFEDLGTDKILNSLFEPSSNNFIKGFYLDNQTIQLTQEVGQIHESVKSTAPAKTILKGEVIADYYDYIFMKAADNISGTTGSYSSISTEVKGELENLYADDKSALHKEVKKAEELLSEAKYDTTKSFEDQKVTVRKLQRENYQIDVDQGEINLGAKPGPPTLFSSVGAIRRIDNSHFSNIILPILEELFVGDEVDKGKFITAVNQLSSIISSPPSLKFKEHDKFLDKPKITKFGYERLESIAAALDKIAEFIPANPLLYFKPYRDAVGVTSLKATMINPDGTSYEAPVYSLKNLLGPGFAGLTKFSKEVLEQIKSLSKTSLHDFSKSNYELFKLQNKLIKHEIETAKTLDNILKKLPNPENLTDLESHATSAKHKELSESLYNQLIDDLDPSDADKKLLKEIEYLKKLSYDYELDFEKYDKELKRRGGDTTNITSRNRGLFKTMRSFMLAVGPVVILDKLLDPHLMRNNGDFISQVFVELNLTKDKENEQKAQVDFSGGVPVYIKYPLVTTGFILGGHALPDFTMGDDYASIVNKKLIQRYGRNYVNFLDVLSGESDAKHYTYLNFYKNRSGDNASRTGFSSKVSASTEGRVKTSFGYMGAFIGASLALLGTQTVFNIAATIANIVTLPFKDFGPKPSVDELAAGLHIGSIIDKTANKKKLTVGDIAAIGAAKLGAYQITYGNKKSNQNLYTFSTQIPTPIFQATFVSKLDPNNNAITMGAGFQFLPILGSGSIPAAPFSVRLRSLTGTNTVRGQSYDIAEKVAKLDKENLTSANLLALFSFPGQFITIDNKDTTLSSTINFLGITSFMGQAVNSLERAIKPRIPLADRSNSNLAALYSLAKFSARSVRSLIGLSQAITIVAPNTLYKAGFSLLNLDTKTVIKPEVGKALRRVAPYLLAYSFASGITSPEGAFSNIGSFLYPNFFAAEAFRLGTAVLPMTAIYGTAVLTSGAFASAESFKHLSGRTNLGYIGREKAKIYSMYDEAIVKRGLEGIAELPLIRTANIRVQMAARNIVMYSAVAALAGLFIRGLGGGSLGFLDIISDSQSAKPTPEELLYNTVNPRYARYRPKNLLDSGLAYLDTLARYATGIFGVDNLFYRDDPNAFLSFGGPFGITETSNNAYRQYNQVQGGGVSDISGSVLNIVRGGDIFSNSDLAARIQSILSTKDIKDLSIHNIVDSLIGSAPRKDPAKIKGAISSSEYKIIRSLSESFQAAVALRQYYLENLAHQRPGELSTQLFMSLYASGNLQLNNKLFKGKNYKIPKTYNPYDSIVGNASFIISSKISNPVYKLQESMSRLLRGITGNADPTVDDVAGDTYSRDTSIKPIVGYFEETFKYVSGALTGQNTMGAGLVTALQTIPLTILTLGSASSFAVQMSMSLIALHQGEVTSSLIRANTQYEQSVKRLPNRTFEIKDGKVYTGSGKNKYAYVTSAVSIKTGFEQQVQGDLRQANKNLFDDLINFIEQDDDIKEIKNLKKQLDAATTLDNKNDLLQKINEKAQSLAKSIRTKIENAFKTEINTGLGGADKSTFGNILDLDQDIAKDIAGKIETEINASVTKAINDEAADLHIKSTIYGQIEDLDRRMHHNASVVVEPPQSAVETKTTRSPSKSSQAESKTINELIRRYGYSGVASQAFRGLAQVINVVQNISGPYEVLSGLTYAIQAKPGLDRYKGAYAAAEGLFSTATAVGVMSLANVLGVTPLLLIGLGVSIYAIDQLFLNKTISKAALTSFLHLDRTIFEPTKRELAGVMYGLSSFFSPLEPLVKPLRAFTIGVTDHVFGGIYNKLSGNQIAQNVAMYFLPSTPDIIDMYRTAKIPREYAFAGARQENLSIFELTMEKKAIEQQGRRRAASLKGEIDHLVHPYLQGSIFTGNPFIDTPYLQSGRGGGGSRLLAKFADPPTISDSLELAIRQKSAIADFYGIGSYVKRKEKEFDKAGFMLAGGFSLASAGIAYNNNPLGILNAVAKKAGSIISAGAKWLADTAAFKKVRPFAGPATAGLTAGFIAYSYFSSREDVNQVGAVGGAVVAGAAGFLLPQAVNPIKRWANNNKLPKGLGKFAGIFGIAAAAALGTYIYTSNLLTTAGVAVGVTTGVLLSPKIAQGGKNLIKFSKPKVMGVINNLKVIGSGQNWIRLVTALAFGGAAFSIANTLFNKDNKNIIVPVVAAATAAGGSLAVSSLLSKAKKPSSLSKLGGLVLIAALLGSVIYGLSREDTRGLTLGLLLGAAGTAAVTAGATAGAMWLTAGAMWLAEKISSTTSSKPPKAAKPSDSKLSELLTGIKSSWNSKKLINIRARAAALTSWPVWLLASQAYFTWESISKINALTEHDDRETYRSRYSNLAGLALGAAAYTAFSLVAKRIPGLTTRSYSGTRRSAKTLRIRRTLSALAAAGIFNYVAGGFIGNLLGDAAYNEQARGKGSNYIVSLFNNLFNPISAAYASGDNKESTTITRTISTAVLGAASILLPVYEAQKAIRVNFKREKERRIKQAIDNSTRATAPVIQVESADSEVPSTNKSIEQAIDNSTSATTPVITVESADSKVPSKEVERRRGNTGEVETKVQNISTSTSKPQSKLKINYISTGDGADKTWIVKNSDSGDRIFSELTEPVSNNLDSAKGKVTLKSSIKKKIVPNDIPKGKLTVIGYVDIEANYSVLSVNYLDKSGSVITRVFYAEGADQGVMNSLIEASDVNNKKGVNHWKNYSGPTGPLEVDYPQNTPFSSTSSPDNGRNILVLKQNTDIDTLNSRAFGHSKDIGSSTVHWVHGVEGYDSNLKSSRGLVVVPYDQQGGQHIADNLRKDGDLHPKSHFKPAQTTSTISSGVNPLNPEVKVGGTSQVLSGVNPLNPEVKVGGTSQVLSGVNPVDPPTPEPTVKVGEKSFTISKIDVELSSGVLILNDKASVKEYLSNVDIQDSIKKLNAAKLDHLSLQRLILYQQLELLEGRTDFPNTKEGKKLKNALKEVSRIAKLKPDSFFSRLLGKSRYDIINATATVDLVFDLADKHGDYVKDINRLGDTLQIRTRGSSSFKAFLVPIDLDYIANQFTALLQFGKQKLIPGILSVSSSIGSFLSSTRKSSFDLIKSITSRVPNIKFPTIGAKVSGPPKKPKPTPPPPYADTPGASTDSPLRPRRYNLLGSAKRLGDKGLQKVDQFFEAPAVQKVLAGIGYTLLIHGIASTYASAASLDYDTSKEGNFVISTYRQFNMLEQHNNYMYYDIKSTSNKLASVMTDQISFLFNMATYPLNFFAGMFVSWAFSQFLQVPLFNLLSGYYEKRLLEEGFYGERSYVFKDLGKQVSTGTITGAVIGAALAGIALTVFPPASGFVALSVIGGGGAAGAVGGGFLSFESFIQSRGSRGVPENPQIAQTRNVAAQQAAQNRVNRQVGGISAVQNVYPAIMQRFTVSQQGSPIQGQVSDFNDLITSTRTYTDEALQNSVVSRTLTDKKGNPYRVLVSSEGTELPIVDLQLSRVGGGDFVPSIVSGYVQRVNTFGALNIYRDKERKVLIGRIVHLKDIQVQTGDWVSSGEIVGRQSGKGPRGDNHFPKMIQVSAEKEELDKYIKSLRTGQFNLSSSNLRTTAGPTPKEEIVRSSNKLTQDEFSKLTPLGQTIYNSTLHNKYVKALADVTAWVEGTDFNRESQYAGYNMIIGKTNISYDDLFKYKHPFVGSGRGYVPVPGIGESSASGRYQIMDTWYTGTGLHLIFDPRKPTPNFSPAVQDLVFRYLLYEKRILDDVSSGNFSDSVLDKAAEIWAGYKLSTTGASRYDNQGTPQGERSSVRRALAARVAFYEREERKELLVKKKEQLRDKLLRETRGSTKYIQINKQIINIDKELKELERSNVTSQDPVSKAKYTAAKPDSDALSPQARQAILSPGRKLTPQQMALIIEEYDNNIETVKNLKKEFKGKKIAVTLSKTQEGVRPQHPNYPNNNPYVVIPKETPTSENITVTPKQGSVVPNIHINVENDQAVAIELLSDPHYYQSLIPNDVFLQDTNFFMRGISRLPQGRIFQDA